MGALVTYESTSRMKAVEVSPGGQTASFGADHEQVLKHVPTATTLERG